MVRPDAFNTASDVARAARRLLRDTGFDLGVLYAGQRPPYAPRGPRAVRTPAELEARFAL
jgi:2-oxoglutarate ferredoxin oxidoreductase subunit beta